MSRVLYMKWHEDWPVRALLSVLAHYEKHIYQHDVEQQGLDAVVAEEWGHMLDARSGWARSPAEAEEQASTVSGQHVVELTPEVLKLALIEWLELEGEGA